MPSHYQLHELHIRAESDHPVASRALHRTLRYKGAKKRSPSEEVDLTLKFNAREIGASVPEDARHLGTGEKGEISVWNAEDRMVLRWGDASVILRPHVGLAQAALTSDVIAAHDSQRRSPLFYMVAYSLAILLRYRGWFPLHAATLAQGGRGALLVGRSGSGKSTATLNLLRKGWKYLSDDTVLLRSMGDHVNAWSFRRNLCLHPDAATYFPELNDREWPPSLSDAEKWQVDIDQIYPGQSVATCEPRLIALPSVVDAPESRVEPAETKTVLAKLINQGAFFLIPDPEVADRHLALLRQLIDQSRTYHLYAGRDALEAPETVHTLLAPLLGSSATTS